MKWLASMQITNSNFTTEKIDGMCEIGQFFVGELQNSFVKKSKKQSAEI